MSEDPKSALTRVPAVDVARELPSMFQLAHALTKARGFVPAHLQTEGAIVACILAGRELGIPPMTALRTINVIEGKVSLSAEVQLALMKRAGIRHKWASATDQEAVLVLERPGEEPHTQRYTIDEAKRAGLAGKQNWQKHPAAMLRARCVSAAATAYAPDVLGGVYVPDELEEMGEPVANTAPQEDHQLETDATEAEALFDQATGQAEIASVVTRDPAPRRSRGGPPRIVYGPDKGVELSVATPEQLASWIGMLSSRLERGDVSGEWGPKVKRWLGDAEKEMAQRMGAEQDRIAEGIEAHQAAEKYPDDLAQDEMPW